MNFEWILSPFAQYATLAAVLTACLALFLSTKIEMARFQRQTSKSTSSTTAGLESLGAEMAQLRQKVIENTPATPAPGLGMNLTKRAQVLKMHQRGEQVETIAGALRISQNEVELLLKLQHLITPGQFGA